MNASFQQDYHLVATEHESTVKEVTQRRQLKIWKSLPSLSQHDMARHTVCLYLSGIEFPNNK